FFNGSFQINNQFIINNGIKLELNGFLSSSNRNIATKIDRMGSLDLTLQKTLCNRKGNLSISLQDPFRWNQFKSVLKYKNIDATSHIIPDMRMLRISFTYNLGSDKVKQSRKRSTGIESIEERMK
nr:outer membrane beta-barrel protein [Dysgonamonadaceae bacterium]